MKWLANRVVLVTVIVASLTLSTSAVVSAHDVLTPLQAFQAAQRLYDHNLFVINQKFNVAIAKDKAIELAALNVAQTPAQKYLARIDFNEARAVDVATWESDLKKLGDPPQLWMFTNPPATTTTTTASGLIL